MCIWASSAIASQATKSVNGWSRWALAVRDRESGQQGSVIGLEGPVMKVLESGSKEAQLRF